MASHGKAHVKEHPPISSSITGGPIFALSWGISSAQRTPEARKTSNTGYDATMPQHNMLDIACGKCSTLKEPKFQDRMVEKPLGEAPIFVSFPARCL
jgi:hypothetical protein